MKKVPDPDPHPCFRVPYPDPVLFLIDNPGLDLARERQMTLRTFLDPILTRVTIPDGVDPDPTFEEKPDPLLTFEKKPDPTR